MTDDTTSPPADLFDPATVDELEAADVTIVHPLTGKPTTMVVTVAGPQHQARRALLSARRQRMRDQLAETGKAPVQTPALSDAEDLETLVECTIAWRGCAQPFSPAAARQLYSDPRRAWLRDQVHAALLDRQRFMTSSAPA